MSRAFTRKQVLGAIRRNQTLAKYKCPECKTGQFKLRSDGTNVCDNCRFEVITDWEWNRRQGVGKSS